jgi:Ni,Fe-hydrogenase I large subunit
LAATLSSLLRVRQLIEVMRSFVDGVYLPDLIAIGGAYKDWFTRGRGLSARARSAAGRFASKPIQGCSHVR